MVKRKLTPYEQTQLARHGVSNSHPRGAQPIEYATGVAEFCGLPLKVSPAVLIPRVETEELVELTLQAIAEKIGLETSIRIAEVGTGSGAISVAIAKHLESINKPISILATDTSADALAMAQSNVERFVNTSSIAFMHTDLLTGCDESFDVIVANLPYIPTEQIEKLDSSVRDYEPITALDGGKDGFEIMRRLLQQAATKLKKSGIILLEVDSSHKESFFKTFEKKYTIEYLKDSFDRHRFIRMDKK